MKILMNWWRKKRLDAAQALIESYGLSIVKIAEVAGIKYLVNADGTHLKLVASAKGKR